MWEKAGAGRVATLDFTAVAGQSKYLSPITPGGATALAIADMFKFPIPQGTTQFMLSIKSTFNSGTLVHGDFSEQKSIAVTGMGDHILTLSEGSGDGSPLLSANGQTPTLRMFTHVSGTNLLKLLHESGRTVQVHLLHGSTFAWPYELPPWSDFYYTYRGIKTVGTPDTKVGNWTFEIQPWVVRDPSHHGRLV